MSDVFGEFNGRGEIVRAMVSTLRDPLGPDQGPALFIYYLAAVERKWGLPVKTLRVPPSPDSYRSGIDFDTWQSDEFPLLIATATPIGEVERYGDGSYGQWFESDVAAIVADESELEAERLADAYGLAITTLVHDNQGLGDVVEHTRLQGAYRLEFPNPERRVIVRAVVPLRCFLTPLVGADTGGPKSLLSGPGFEASQGSPPPPYTPPGDWPQIQSVDTIITAEPLGTDPLPGE